MRFQKQVANFIELVGHTVLEDISVKLQETGEWWPRLLRYSCSPKPSAVVNSWNADFIDNAPLGGLGRHISRQLASKNILGTMSIYARYCSIVQSSGMGKSRLLDEFSRSFFLVPINLRPANTDGMSYLLFPVMACQTHLLGFPPPDNQVRDFLSGPADTAFDRACNFLLTLFGKCKEAVAKFDCRDKAERVQEFRRFMSEGQSMRYVGGNRQMFFNDVVEQAQYLTKAVCCSLLIIFVILSYSL